MTRKKIYLGLLVATAIVAVVVVIGGRQVSQSSQSPITLGVNDGQLAPCPDTPNCVSTQAVDPSKKMAAIPWSSETAAAMERLVATVKAFPRTTIVEQSDDYLRVEFRSLIFRYVDDVEFFVSEDEQVIHFRSASRIGYSDLGANRKRMSQFCERFKTQ